jgi:hypothetical protein
MSAARAATEQCEYRDEHPALAARMTGIEGRIERLEERDEKEKGELFALMRGVSDRLSNLEGRMIGYLALASGVGGLFLLVAKVILDKLVRGAP